MQPHRKHTLQHRTLGRTLLFGLGGPRGRARTVNTVYRLLPFTSSHRLQGLPFTTVYRLPWLPFTTVYMYNRYRLPPFTGCPVYSCPVYSCPVYSAPVYSAPVYSWPVGGVTRQPPCLPFTVVPFTPAVYTVTIVTLQPFTG